MPFPYHLGNHWLPFNSFLGFSYFLLPPLQFVSVLFHVTLSNKIQIQISTAVLVKMYDHRDKCYMVNQAVINYFSNIFPLFAHLVSVLDHGTKLWWDSRKRSSWCQAKKKNQYILCIAFWVTEQRSEIILTALYCLTSRFQMIWPHWICC